MTTEFINSCQDRDGKHTTKTAIPKFASFKPNPPSQIRGQDTGVTGNVNGYPKIQDDAVGESVSRSKAHKQTLGRCHPRSHHEFSTKREVNRHTESESARQDSRPGESVCRSFVIDRVGDPNNLNFGALHRYATASYLRFGAGNVIGSPTNQRIDRTASTEKGIVLSDDTHGLPKKRDRNARWRLDQEGERELKIKPRDEVDLAIDSAVDFVSLDAARRAKRRREVDRLHVSSSDEDGAHYRSVKDKTRSQEEPTDQDLKYNSNESFSEDTEGGRPLSLDEMAKKRVQLSGRTDAEPTNFEAWVDLINHQDSELGRERASLTNAERRSNAEIKVSIYEKALRKVKHSEGREVLLLGMMQETTRIWGSDKVLSCWRSILQQNPQSLRLWTKYLDFMQTSFPDFRFEQVQSVYLDCLTLTHQTRASTEMIPDGQNKVFDVQIYLVLRMTLFMREGGFAEHATAAWQALLEFAFFKPITVQASNRNKDGSSREVAISMFEKFWDSEVSRVGEEGAKGWASFSQKQGEPPQSRGETTNDLEDTDDRWKLWLASEQWYTLLSRNPARTIDDVEENDPYRIVLFSDIRSYLIDPPSVASQQLLLDAFVAFCCLPPFAAEGHESRSRLWGRDCFLRNDALRLNSKLQDSWNLRSLEHIRSLGKQYSIHEEDSRLRLGTRTPFQFPVQDYQVCSDTLFAGKQWFSAFDTWQEQCFGDGGPVEVAWVLRTLKSLVNHGAGGEAVALYVLALELRISPGTVRKTAKSLLRRLPFSIRLYNAYALIEYRLADSKQGEGIITTSITIGKKVDGVPQRDFMLLWRTWIWETLSAHSAQEALARLLALGDEEIQMPVSELHLPDDLGSAKPALLLRTERSLVAIRDQLLSLGAYSQASFAIECLFLFAYLRNAQSLSAATSEFESNTALVSAHIPSSSSSHEYLHQSFARLLYHHATHTHSFKPSDIRSFLAETIAQFPQNTIFLSLYAWNEARFRIDDRMRSVVKEVILGGSGDTKSKAQESVIPHFFAVYTELHRGVTFGSNISTVRSTFERAVESDSGAHCAGLWKLYFQFELSRSEPERAKTVFWRSLGACPWAQDLYLLAFEHLRCEKVMDEADLRGLYELMVEKELRVHVRIQDVSRGSGGRQLNKR